MWQIELRLAQISGGFRFRRKRKRFGVGLLVSLMSLWSAGLHAELPEAKQANQIDFARQVLPILSNKCFVCHGPDEKARKGKLRLDTPEGAFKALDDGMFVVKPGANYLRT